MVDSTVKLVSVVDGRCAHHIVIASRTDCIWRGVIFQDRTSDLPEAAGRNDVSGKWLPSSRRGVVRQRIKDLWPPTEIPFSLLLCWHAQIQRGRAPRTQT